MSTGNLTGPSGPELETLCKNLASKSADLERPGAWPAEQLLWCGRAGVFRALMPIEAGGLGWSEADQVRLYLRLAEADLTTTFVITQRMGACRRIAGSENRLLRDAWLPPLLEGTRFATVGISHLTTSRRHLKRPALRARVDGEGLVLEGYSPWVTGGVYADLLVVGADLEDGRQVLAAVPEDRVGVEASPGIELMALTASCTDRVDFDQVRITAEDLIAGPIEEVMSGGTGAGTGGLQTSTLAVGLSRAAVAFLQTEAERRNDLQAAASRLGDDCDALSEELIAAAEGRPECSPGEIRQRANSLALRSTQAALMAAKGAGFVAGHPVGRWCREALFFLVWSCPQPVAQAHLCELAGIQD